MRYVVLARKYRPGSFLAVKGQEHVTRSLANAIRRDKIGQAYLFSGPRGVGKTSIARILAKSLNCEKGPTPEPCLECSNCKEITNGTSLAVWEIDGASHNSVDNVRELIDSFRSSPPPGYRYKLYIIDEVHMLSVAAFNALLKSLEEPPPNTVFILATTEVHKIPDTVLSRCQRFDLRALGMHQIEEQLRAVAEKESIAIEDDAVRLIARAADGSMRDAETLLERVHSFCEGQVTALETSQVLGTVSKSVLFSLSQAIVAHDAAKVLGIVREVFVSGTDEASFIRELVGHWRELFLAKISREEDLKGLEIREDDIVNLKRIVSGMSFDDVQDLYRIIREGCDAALRSSYVKLSLEALLVRATHRRPMREMAQLVEAITSGKTGVSHDTTGGESSTKAAPPSQPAPLKQSASSLSPASTQQQQPKVVRIETPSTAPLLGASSLETPSSGTSSSPNTTSMLEWEKFVAFVGARGAKILAEQLKRVRALIFEPGTLSVAGPEFSLSGIKRDAVRVKEMLTAFSETQGQVVTDWRCTFQVEKPGTAAGGGNPSGDAVTSHPAVQSVQKFFPGSMVESVKDKM